MRAIDYEISLSDQEIDKIVRYMAEIEILLYHASYGPSFADPQDDFERKVNIVHDMSKKAYLMFCTLLYDVFKMRDWAQKGTKFPTVVDLTIPDLRGDDRAVVEKHLGK